MRLHSILDNNIFVDYTVKNESGKDYEIGNQVEGAIKLRLKVTTTDNSVFTDDTLLPAVSANSAEASLTVVKISVGKLYKSIAYELVQ